MVRETEIYFQIEENGSGISNIRYWLFISQCTYTKAIKYKAIKYMLLEWSGKLRIWKYKYNSVYLH